MPRPRNPENTGLPARWRKRGRVYWYSVPADERDRWGGQQTFRLGTSLPEAMATWAARMSRSREIRTVGQLLERYAAEVVPKKAATTRRHNATAIRVLTGAIGDLPIAHIKPVDVYRYIDVRTGKTAAEREIEVLSHACTMAVRWGLIERHPFRGEIRLEGRQPRDRYVTDDELAKMLTVAGPVLSAFLRIKMLTGLRRGDILRLTEGACREDGIHVTPSKTKRSGRSVIYSWTPALQEAVAAARAARPVPSLLLFVTRDGRPYLDDARGTATAFRSLWARFMGRWRDIGGEPFNDSDLRAKVASDAESVTRAQSLLVHASPATTARIYRRRPERVEPTK